MQNGYSGSAWFQTSYGMKGGHNCWMALANFKKA